MAFHCQFLQYYDAAGHSSGRTALCPVFYNIIIHIVMIDGAVYLPVPLEIFAGGGEDLSAPAVVNVDAEVEVVDLVVVGLRDTEEVVQPDPVRIDGVGK